MPKSSQHPDVANTQPPSSLSSPPASQERPAQRPFSAAPYSLAAQVLQRHAQLARLNHFEHLELPENADQEMIRHAFRQAVLRFHPDRLEGQDAQLRPLAKEIICRLGVAFRVLDDASTRTAYRQNLRDYAPLSAVRSSIPPARSTIPARPGSPSRPVDLAARVMS